MAKTKGIKPDIAGGRTLAKMRRGKGQDGGGKQRHKKATWYQAGKNNVSQFRGKIGAWPEGEIPLDLKRRLEATSN